MNICHLIDARITPALRTFGLPEATTAMTTPSTRPEFGDYQVNGIMAAARFLGENPRELAQSVLDQVDFSDVADKAQVAGSGFINIYLKNSWLAEQCLLAAHDKRLGIARVTHPLKIVVDYSGPNLAKEMHVGHLRSTIIGDSLVRVLSFLGHDVIPQNHVGDWGTQFGMLIANTPALESTGGDSALSLADLEALYQQAQQRFEEEPSFASAARECLVRLQSGDKECLRIWRQLVDISLDHLDEVYEKLNLKLSRASLKPESSYNPDLETIVRELQAAGLVTESDGAQCSFLEEFQDDNGYSTPVIVKKSDGGYTYATTDLAALSYRSSSLNANRVLYFADARQTLHFRQVFTLARKARFVEPAVALEHCAFGTMLGENGRPFKTRDGGTVKLVDLLIEAEERAYDLVSQRNHDLSESEMRDIAHKVGIGAVKYSELSKNRLSDYAFSFESMLSLEGNTAPYLQYAFARIRSIFRRAGYRIPNDGTGDREWVAPDSRISVDDPAERALALKLLQFTEPVENVARDCFPSQLSSYLYELSGRFMFFYENCPIMMPGVAPHLRISRLTLAYLTLQTLRTGLDLLGVEAPSRM